MFHLDFWLRIVSYLLIFKSAKKKKERALKSTHKGLLIWCLYHPTISAFSLLTEVFEWSHCDFISLHYVPGFCVSSLSLEHVQHLLGLAHLDTIWRMTAMRNCAQLMTEEASENSHGQSQTSSVSGNNHRRIGTWGPFFGFFLHAKIPVFSLFILFFWDWWKTRPSFVPEATWHLFKAVLSCRCV